MIRCALALLLGFVAAVPAMALPEDGDRYHLVVVTADTPSDAGTQLLDTMRQHPRVAPISVRCHTHHWRTSSQIYRSRYANALPPNRLPIVALVKPSGGVIYKASGDRVPRAEQMREELIAAARLDQSNPPPRRYNLVSYSVGQCPDGNCPTPSPAQPDYPSTPDFRQPFGPGGALDGAIPDSVDIDTEASLFRVPTWVYAVGSGAVLLVVGGFLVFVVVLGVACFFWLRG